MKIYNVDDRYFIPPRNNYANSEVVVQTTESLDQLSGKGSA